MTLTAKAIAAAVILAAPALHAGARTAADFFAEAPAQVLPLLDRNARLDMLDYHRHQLPTTTPNHFDGAAKVLAESDGCLDVQVSRDANIQFAVVPLKGDTLIAVIETVLTPVADSGITFYRTDWTPARTQPAMPAASDFIPKDKRKELKDAELPQSAYIRVSYDDAKGVFTFINTTPAYYTSVDRPEGLGAMRHSIAMRFDGKKFVEQPAADEN